MPLLNIRISASERIKLKALAQTGGFTNLSQFVRHQLGLPTTAQIDADAVPDKEVLDLEHILPLMTKHTDYLQEANRNINRICKSLGVSTENPGISRAQKKQSEEGFVRG